MDQDKSIDFSQIREDRNIGAMRRIAVLKFFLRAFGALFFIIAVWLALFAPKLKAVYDNGIKAKNLLEQAQHQIVNRDLVGGGASLKEANLALVSAQQDFSKVYGVRWIPYIGNQVKAADQLLIAGVNLSSSGARVVELLAEATKDIRNETLLFSEITAAHKKKILAKFVEAQPALVSVQGEIARAEEAVAKIDAAKLVPALSRVVTPLQKYLPVMRNIADQAVPMVNVLPQLAGFEQQRSYLFLLQNTHELRPTGGFIGTFGILKLLDGEILDFKTDNIYNLDRAFDADELVLTPQQIMDRPSPEPIAIYLEQRQWSLRDANWDPDFPTTAVVAQEIWAEENKIAADLEKQRFLRDKKNREKDFITTYPQERVDGVIAVTPELIEGLLTITGPITIDGIRFTHENVQDELEYRVGYEFRELGIDESNRKEIVRHLADAIKTKIFSLPFSRLADVLQIGMESLSKKQVLLYMNDASLQEQVVARGWAGEVRQTNGDYLFVVDSNLGSLKSDQFIDRFIDYSIEKNGDRYRATVKVTHKHNGEFAWNSTRLRSYTRVYAPLGSNLITSSGAMFNDSVKDPENKPGEVKVSEEHGKTVFGAFFSVEPKETGTLTFVYDLPESVTKAIESGVYSLIVQKQPGTEAVLTLNQDFDKTIKSTSHTNFEQGLLNSILRTQVILDRDVEFIVKF